MHYHELGCSPSGEIIFVIRSPEGRALALVTKLGEYQRAEADARMIVAALNAFAAVAPRQPAERIGGEGEETLERTG